MLSEKQNNTFSASVRTRTRSRSSRPSRQLFKKKVVAVNTCNYAGKKKRERTADFGRKPHWKKAIVTLKEGEKIELV